MQTTEWWLPGGREVGGDGQGEGGPVHGNQGDWTLGGGHTVECTDVGL